MTNLETILEVASRQLPAAGVDCILIGGFAVNVHGYELEERIRAPFHMPEDAPQVLDLSRCRERRSSRRTAEYRMSNRN